MSLLERVMMRLVGLERTAGVVEKPQAPRTDRRAGHWMGERSTCRWRFKC